MARTRLQQLLVPDNGTTTNVGDKERSGPHKRSNSAKERATLYGDKGTLKASVFSYDFTPAGQTKPELHGEPLYEYDKFPEDKDEKGLEQHCASAIRWHMKDLLSCIASRNKPVADIEQGHISTASCILANLSLKLGRSLAWDPQAGRITQDEEANRLLSRAYRAPWVHPDAKLI